MKTLLIKKNPYSYSRATSLAVLISLISIILTPFVGALHAEDFGITTKQDRLMPFSEREGNLGVGVKVGELSGLNLEFWNTSMTAINWSLVAGPGRWGAGFSHNWMIDRTLLSSGWDRYALVPYLGAGMLFGFDRIEEARGHYTEKTFMAVQFPIGIEYMPQFERFSIFGQILPSIEVTPAALSFLSADLGARFYF